MGGMPAEILVVDDERTIREGLRALLSGEGFAVRTARNGEEALAKFAEKTPDLILLDVMMPRRNGFLVCNAIRERNRSVPVIFLTGKDAEVDQVRGMGLGADDYISKSVGEGLLLARLRRALERSEQARAGADRRNVVRIGKSTVDFDRRTITEDDRIEEMTASEASILELLYSNRGQIQAEKAIADRLYGVESAFDSRVIRAHVKNLRRKLGTAGQLIFNSWGGNYYMPADT